MRPDLRRFLRLRQDSVLTLSKQSLGPKDPAEAVRLLVAKNQSDVQPALNRGMAKIILRNTVLKLDWRLRRVLADATWIEVKNGVTQAFTFDEHQKITRSRNCSRLKTRDEV
jgi:hypothetical protein